MWFTGTSFYLCYLTTSTFIIHIRIKLQFCSFASADQYFKIVLCGGCCPTQLPFLFLKVNRKVSEWSVHPLTAATNAERWIASSVILPVWKVKLCLLVLPFEWFNWITIPVCAEMFGGEGAAQVPCHELVFDSLPSDFQSIHLSSQWEWGELLFQVNFAAHGLPLRGKPDLSGQILVKWWPRSLRWRSTSRLMSGKLEDAECSACPFYDTSTTLGGQSNSRALLLAWTESVSCYRVAVWPWPNAQLDAQLDAPSEQERIFGSCGEFPV